MTARSFNLSRFDQRQTILFNRMAEWGTDGRIKPDAPVYSPFIRRPENLELE
jgi:NAD(P)H dehydrogenase (quinone)